nr:MAG TPA: hypothetical protein [Caudoviricetes sp.]DAT10372.1 MAG TPA: hypothetical protein [Caudoviricetes sp.]
MCCHSYAYRFNTFRSNSSAFPRKAVPLHFNSLR